MKFSGKFREEGIALISVMLMVLFLSLLIGSFARFHIGTESKAIEESLLRIRQYWVCVAGWERYRAEVIDSGDYKWLSYDSDDSKDLLNKDDDLASGENTAPTGIMTGGSVISYGSSESLITFEMDVTVDVGTSSPKDTINTTDTGTTCQITSVSDPHSQGQTVLFPSMTGGNLSEDYRDGFNSRVDSDTHRKLEVTFCAVGFLESGLTDLIVTGWRYGI